MSEYEAQVILIRKKEGEEEEIIITTASRTKKQWPEETINKLLDVLQDQIKEFVVTNKEVKS